MSPCWVCEGQGFVRFIEDEDDSNFSECSTCSGSGRVGSKRVPARAVPLISPFMGAALHDRSRIGGDK